MNEDRAMAEWRGRDLVERFNRALSQASENKLASSRRSSLAFAKRLLADLKEHAAQHPFLALERLDEVEIDVGKIEAEIDQQEITANAEGPIHDATFFAMPLSKQCEVLGISQETLPLARIEGRWLVDDAQYKRPEDAALAHFRSLGFRGTACEGTAPLLLMKAACLDLLASVSQFGREDACSRYFEAQCLINRDRSADIVAAVDQVDEGRVTRNLREIVNVLNGRGDPTPDVGDLLTIWRALPPGRLANFTHRICEDFDYRAGWPDLTLVENGKVRFVEVKTSDKLHALQRNVIRDVLLPSGSDVCVVRITAAKAGGTH